MDIIKTKDVLFCISYYQALKHLNSLNRIKIDYKSFTYFWTATYAYFQLQIFNVAEFVNNSW